MISSIGEIVEKWIWGQPSESPMIDSIPGLVDSQRIKPEAFIGPVLPTSESKVSDYMQALVNCSDNAETCAKEVGNFLLDNLGPEAVKQAYSEISEGNVSVQNLASMTLPTIITLVALKSLIQPVYQSVKSGNAKKNIEKFIQENQEILSKYLNDYENVVKILGKSFKLEGERLINNTTGAVIEGFKTYHDTIVAEVIKNAPEILQNLVKRMGIKNADYLPHLAAAMIVIRDVLLRDGETVLFQANNLYQKKLENLKSKNNLKQAKKGNTVITSDEEKYKTIAKEQADEFKSKLINQKLKGTVKALSTLSEKTLNSFTKRVEKIAAEQAKLTAEKETDSRRSCPSVGDTLGRVANGAAYYTGLSYLWNNCCSRRGRPQQDNSTDATRDAAPAASRLKKD